MPEVGEVWLTVAGGEGPVVGDEEPEAGDEEVDMGEWGIRMPRADHAQPPSAERSTQVWVAVEACVADAPGDGALR